MSNTLSEPSPIDAVELGMFAAVAQGAQIADIRSTHEFTPGIYIRGCQIPPNTILVSETHLTEHPFVIAWGEVSVWTEETGWQHYEAPYFGITKPGTRRVLATRKGVFWTTYHATESTDVEEISARILGPRDNQLLPEELRQISFWRTESLIP